MLTLDDIVRVTKKSLLVERDAVDKLRYQDNYIEHIDGNIYYVADFDGLAKKLKKQGHEYGNPSKVYIIDKNARLCWLTIVSKKETFEEITKRYESYLEDL